jgi:hypothetical protein
MCYDKAVSDEAVSDEAVSDEAVEFQPGAEIRQQDPVTTRIFYR